MEFASGRRGKKEADIVLERKSSFWSSAVRRKKADRVLDLKSKSQKKKVKESGCAYLMNRLWDSSFEPKYLKYQATSLGKSN
jgi:hypothetical protein